MRGKRIHCLRHLVDMIRKNQFLRSKAEDESQCLLDIIHTTCWHTVKGMAGECDFGTSIFIVIPSKAIIQDRLLTSRSILPWVKALSMRRHKFVQLVLAQGLPWVLGSPCLTLWTTLPKLPCEHAIPWGSEDGDFPKSLIVSFRSCEKSLLLYHQERQHCVSGTATDRTFLSL